VSIIETDLSKSNHLLALWSALWRRILAVRRAFSLFFLATSSEFGDKAAQLFVMGTERSHWKKRNERRTKIA
jgi:hypothetical protein